ncbi:MAG: DUF4381 domain-containing protein [Desulfobulbaceae bacterium]|nr:DUF4381 domain-containing protein [Desulfobulbaceae bacterium]
MNPMQDPLAQLRPLHSPDPITWWPPAPGWWLLVLVIGTLIGLIVWQLRRTKLKRAALLELKQIRAMQVSGEEKIRSLSLLLKRYVLAIYPGKEVASLTGESWLRFLDQRLGQPSKPFQKGVGQVFGIGLYGPKIECDLDQLCGLVSQWIKKNRSKG